MDRLDLPECLSFATEGLVTANVAVEPLDNINSVFDRMKQGGIQRRVVLTP